MKNHNPQFEMPPRFSAHDLDENREGRMSAAQTQRLTRQTNRLRLVAGVVVGALGMLSVAMFDMTSAQLQLPYLCLSVTMMFLVGVTWWADNQYMRNKLREGVVSTVQGEAIPIMTQHDEGTTHRVKVGSKTFTLTEMEFHAFEAGQPYRVYYFDGKMLSFEQAGGDDALASHDHRGEDTQREESELPTAASKNIPSLAPRPQSLKKGESE